jgi:hypothetical protein
MAPVAQLKCPFFVCRKRQALEDLAVKPVTQFPVEISNEDAFASFKNVRHVTIKKVSERESKNFVDTLNLSAFCRAIRALAL